MASKTAEKNLWNRMREALRVFRADVHYTRVENAVSDGFPDVEVSLMWQKVNYCATFELKTAYRPEKIETNVDASHIRPGQIRWLKKRWATGGSSWILIQIGSGKDLARYLLPGHIVSEAQEGKPESWYVANSVCRPSDPLDRIVQTGCTWRQLDES